MRSLIATAFAVCALAACTAAAEPDDSSQVIIEDGLVLAELFTSQGCSSCPPAEAHFETLTDRDDIAVIVWHVDVWDTLVHGGSSWKDPYSDPAFTKRLRNYNINIRSTPQIYTPQAIIGGETPIIGSRKQQINEAIANAERPSVSVKITDGKVTLSGAETKAEIIYVRLLKEHSTDVKGGENRGRKLSGKNIALQGLMLGKWSGVTTSYDLPEVAAGETCAVIVQQPRTGRVIGAGMCA